jgi:hypothetical protein
MYDSNMDGERINKVEMGSWARIPDIRFVKWDMKP